MISLLDVNFLIGLLDAGHTHHTLCHDWFAEHRQAGWATSPTTQNGCIRILSLASYSYRLPVAEIARRLTRATDAPDHVFWPEPLSLADARVFDHSVMLSSRELTDHYLLALAVSQGGRLVTLDRGVKLTAVRTATPQHLLVLQNPPAKA